jgi:membrane dipeptidase
MISKEIVDVAGLNKVRNAMRAHGYSDTLMAKLCNENWLRVLAITWGES